MVTDCVVREYKLYGSEDKTVASEMKNLLNDGYKVTLHYSAGGVGCVLLEAIQEKEEEKPKTKTTKTTKKDSAAE
ncbi:hypothetical protein [Selenomonas sp. AE3005]|uniref:hypothetical protein n=1 Tax=Selenomonas sp. AE3005 TaxID=1485543 RepID=UPI000487A8C3|nr:hypothetical protein [Selenomonas sp. AE3005]